MADAAVVALEAERTQLTSAVTANKESAVNWQTLLRFEYSLAKRVGTRDAWRQLGLLYRAAVVALPREEQRRPEAYCIQVDEARVHCRMGASDARTLLKATRAMPAGRINWPVWQASIVLEAQNGDGIAVKLLLAEARSRFAGNAAVQQHFQLMDRVMKDGGIGSVARLSFDDDIPAARATLVGPSMLVDASTVSAAAAEGASAAATAKAVKLPPQRVPRVPEPSAVAAAASSLSPPELPTAAAVAVHTHGTTVVTVGGPVAVLSAAASSAPSASAAATPSGPLGTITAAVTVSERQQQRRAPPAMASAANAVAAPSNAAAAAIIGGGIAAALRRRRTSTMPRMSSIYMSSLSPVAEGRTDRRSGEASSSDAAEEESSITSSSGSSSNRSGETSRASSSSASSGGVSFGGSSSRMSCTGTMSTNTDFSVVLRPSLISNTSGRASIDCSNRDDGATTTAAPSGLTATSTIERGLLRGGGGLPAPRVAAASSAVAPSTSALGSVAAAASNSNEGPAPRRFEIPDYIRGFDPKRGGGSSSSSAAAAAVVAAATPNAAPAFSSSRRTPFAEIASGNERLHLKPDDKPSMPESGRGGGRAAMADPDDAIAISPVSKSTSTTSTSTRLASAVEAAAAVPTVHQQSSATTGSAAAPLQHVAPAAPMSAKLTAPMSAKASDELAERQLAALRRRRSVRFGSSDVVENQPPVPSPPAAPPPYEMNMPQQPRRNSLNDSAESADSGMSPVRPAPRSSLALPPPLPAAVLATTDAHPASSAQPNPFADLALSHEVVRVGKRSFLRLDCIGKGGSSRVYRVLGEDLVAYALKRVRLTRMDAVSIAPYSNEIALLRKLNDVSPRTAAPAAAPGHRQPLGPQKHIIRLIDAEVAYEMRCIHMVMELGQMDLNGMLEKSPAPVSGGPYTDENILRVVWKEMLLAVQTIHNARIVHGDLKPANFVFVEGVLKLIDFGIAKAINNDTTNIVRDTQVGTINYISPEALSDVSGSSGTSYPSSMMNFKLGRASDIWSLGVILYQMTYGRTPFAEFSLFSKLAAIVNPKHEISYPTINDADLLAVLKSCLQREPSKRPSLQELLDSPFLRPSRSATRPSPSTDTETLVSILTAFSGSPNAAFLLSKRSTTDVAHMLQRGRSMAQILEDISASLGGEDVMDMS